MSKPAMPGFWQGTSADVAVRLGARSARKIPICAASAHIDRLSPAQTVSELTALDSPNESSVCEVLQARLLAGEIYTGVSAMLIAVNPCEWLPNIYSDAAIDRYLGSEANPPPHVFRTAATLHRGMRHGRSQSVVISGESGAGKTQTFKRMMQFISAACTGSPTKAPKTPGGPGGAAGASGSSSTSVEALLIETVPILEAYGNATTPHNPDSSRFGKFVVLHFKEGGALAGIAVRTYLLETTRAIKQGDGAHSSHTQTVPARIAACVH